MAKLITCNVCGSEEFNDLGNILQCKYCRHKMPRPKENAELLERANLLRTEALDFDEAIAQYDEIIRISPDEAEAYWGKLLCRYGIQYEKDENGTYLPTCHRTIASCSIMDDADYRMALKLAEPGMEGYYQEQAELIDKYQRKILAIVQREKPYDVFISFKSKDALGDPTEDQLIAQKIYDYLTYNKNLKVFFSEVTLKSAAGEEFEPRIFAALNSAPVMILVGTRPQHLNAHWVKNEWSRFKAMKKAAEEANQLPKYLIPGMTAEQLPGALSGLQAVDFTKIGADLDLYNTVKRICEHHEEARRKAAKPAERSRGGEDAGSRRANAAAQAAEHANNLNALGWQQLESANYDKAGKFFQRALESDIRCATAYWGLLLVNYRMIDDLALSLLPLDITTDDLYRQAMQYGSTEEQARFKKVADSCKANFNYQYEVKNLQKIYESNLKNERKPFDQEADALFDDLFIAKTAKNQLSGKITELQHKHKRIHIGYAAMLLLSAILLVVGMSLLSTITLTALNNPSAIEDDIVTTVLSFCLPLPMSLFVLLYSIVLRIRCKGSLKAILILPVLIASFVIGLTIMGALMAMVESNLVLLYFLPVIGALFAVLAVAWLVFRILRKISIASEIKNLQTKVENTNGAVDMLMKQIRDRSAKQIEDLNHRYWEKNGSSIVLLPVEYIADKI